MSDKRTGEENHVAGPHGKNSAVASSALSFSFPWTFLLKPGLLRIALADLDRLTACLFIKVAHFQEEE